MPDYDAILILGGGLDDDGRPTPWVQARLDAALAQPGTALLIPLSAGTTHKPPKLDASRFPVLEAKAGAEYLIERGCVAERIVMDTWSLDTIGNAFFARMMHCETRGLRRLLVVTSRFHMPRSRAIFDWVFGLTPVPFPYRIDYLETPDDGLDAAALRSREEKEAASLKSFECTASRIVTLAEAHRFVFVEHRAYSASGGATEAPTNPELAKSY